MGENSIDAVAEAYGWLWHVSEHTDGRDALIYDEDGFEVARVSNLSREVVYRQYGELLK